MQAWPACPCDRTCCRMQHHWKSFKALQVQMTQEHNAEAQVCGSSKRLLKYIQIFNSSTTMHANEVSSILFLQNIIQPKTWRKRAVISIFCMQCWSNSYCMTTIWQRWDCCLSKRAGPNLSCKLICIPKVTASNSGIFLTAATAWTSHLLWAIGGVLQCYQKHWGPQRPSFSLAATILCGLQQDPTNTGKGSLFQDVHELGISAVTELLCWQILHQRKASMRHQSWLACTVSIAHGSRLSIRVLREREASWHDAAQT